MRHNVLYWILAFQSQGDDWRWRELPTLSHVVRAGPAVHVQRTTIVTHSVCTTKSISSNSPVALIQERLLNRDSAPGQGRMARYLSVQFRAHRTTMVRCTQPSTSNAFQSYTCSSKS